MFNFVSGVYGLECYKTQELYFELEMAKWNVAQSKFKIPESVCSKPCPMGQIKNFEVDLLIFDESKFYHIDLPFSN